MMFDAAMAATTEAVAERSADSHDARDHGAREPRYVEPHVDDAPVAVGTPPHLAGLDGEAATYATAPYVTEVDGEALRYAATGLPAGFTIDDVARDGGGQTAAQALRPADRQPRADRGHRRERRCPPVALGHGIVKRASVG